MLAVVWGQVAMLRLCWLSVPNNSSLLAVSAAEVSFGQLGRQEGSIEGLIEDVLKAHPPLSLVLELRTTPLGDGQYAKIKVQSAWSPLPILQAGSEIIVSARSGFDTPQARAYPLGSPSWFLNVWGGKNLTDRLVHFNPRAGSGGLVLNHCVDGRWGVQQNLALPAALAKEHISAPFKLAVRLGTHEWAFRLIHDGRLSGDAPGSSSATIATYKRVGDFDGAMELQLYGVSDPVVTVSHEAIDEALPTVLPRHR